MSTDIEYEVLREDAEHVWVRCNCASHVGSAYPELVGALHGSTHCCNASHHGAPGEVRFAKPPNRLLRLHRFIDAFDAYHDGIDRTSGSKAWADLCLARLALDLDA